MADSIQEGSQITKSPNHQVTKLLKLGGFINMIFCQRCTHPNPYNRESCSACGTRLMIVSNTATAAAYGGAESLLKPSMEEHLLERVSVLESSLQRAHEQLDILLDLLHSQATTGLYDHAMLDALVEHLSERGSVEEGKLDALWRNRIAEHYEESNERERFDKRNEQMIR